MMQLKAGEILRTVTDRDRNECTLRAVFTRDFGEILQHARDYNCCVAQLVRYTLTLDLNVWEIEENQAFMLDLVAQVIPNFNITIPISCAALFSSVYFATGRSASERHCGRGHH
jgi:hypothetical protein